MMTLDDQEPGKKKTKTNPYAYKKHFAVSWI